MFRFLSIKKLKFYIARIRHTESKIQIDILRSPLHRQSVILSSSEFWAIEKLAENYLYDGCCDMIVPR